MSLRRQNNLTTVVLSDVTKASSALPSVGTVVTNENLEAGAIVMTDVGMRRTTLGTLADGDGFFIVEGKGAGNVVNKSSILHKGRIAITSKKHLPAKQQTTAIGFNGTTGSLPVANSTSFFVKVRKNDNDAANRSQPEGIYAQFKTDSTGSQEELCLGLVANGIKNFSQQPANGYLRFEALTNGTFTALGAAATVTFNSRSVDSTSHGLVAGDLVRIGSSAATSPVYKVASATTNNFVLTFAYQGETATIGIGDAGKMTVVTAYGIKLTGKVAPFDVTSFRDYYANRFSATFSDPEVLVTHLQGAQNGNGVWQQVAMDEYFSYGFKGQNEMIATPPVARDQRVKIPGFGGNTALTSKYSAIQINWTESIPGLVTTAGSQGSVLIYLNLKDNAGLGELDTTPDNTGETLAVALGLTAANLNE